MIQIIDKDGYSNQSGFIQVIHQNSKPEYNSISCVAGEVINSGEAVFIDSDNLLYVMDITDGSHYEKCVGVANQSVITGDICKVTTSGRLSVIGSGWVAGEIYYISSTGILTPTPPIIGWCQKVGVGIDTNTISINIEMGVELI